MLKEAMLYEKLPEAAVRCYLCAHHCNIKSGKFGFCGVRENREGVLYTHTYGDVIARHVDPVEKKPLRHFLPGSLTYSIATPGCNFRCGFCQNWQISQQNYRRDQPGGPKLIPEQIVNAARSTKCLSISYTYTEPTIFFEYAFETARLAHVGIPVSAAHRKMRCYQVPLGNNS
ncbi:MAG: radical SAM protein [Chitinivibrionales bacterium]|nr:radical SAM protein [Chitinivibrionales bacterium]